MHLVSCPKNVSATFHNHILITILLFTATSTWIKSVKVHGHHTNYFDYFDLNKQTFHMFLLCDLHFLLWSCIMGFLNLVTNKSKRLKIQSQGVTCNNVEMLVVVRTLKKCQSAFSDRKPPRGRRGGYSPKFWVGVCRTVLKTLTLFQTPFQTWPRKSVPINL